MAKQTKTIGTGITAREVTSYDGEDATDAFVRFAHQMKVALSKSGGQFGAYVLQTERKCRRILARAGSAPFAADSHADYASRILIAIKQTKDWIAKGDADIAARQALDVGHLCTEFRMKVLWERYALSGRKTKSVLNDGGRTANKNRTDAATPRHTEWQRMADKLWNRNPHLSATVIGDRIAETLGGNGNTIRRKISRKN
jgi:hypothetical protein